MLGSAGRLECLPGSSSFSFEVFLDANVVDLTPLAYFVLRIWKFFVKVLKILKLNFFSKNNSIYSKSCSGHMESGFGNCAKFLWPETQKILALCPNFRKVLFLPEIFPLECSTGRVECLTDEHWVFLQIGFSSEKPLKDIKLYLRPKNVSPKSSSGHVDFVFDTLVENFRHKSGISSFKIRKERQTYLFLDKKPFRLKDFLCWTYGMRC